MTRQILAVSLPLDHQHHQVNFAAHDSTQLAAKRANSIKSIREAGYDLEPYTKGPEEGVGELNKVLDSKKWDGVLVSGAIKSDPDLLQWYNVVLEAVGQHAPQAKLIHHTGADDVIPAIRQECPL